MRISDSNLQSITTSTQQTGGASPASAGSRAGLNRAESRGDRVQLSNLSSALKSLSADSPERSAWIDQLGAVYRSGGYQVNAGAVSQALISDASCG